MVKYYWSKFVKKIRGSSVKGSFVHKTSKIEAGSSFINSNMDRHSFCGYDCDIYHTKIGSFCSIANGVVIGGGKHPTDWVGMSPVFYEGKDSVKEKFSTFKREKPLLTSIGNDVWIGRNVIIKEGVKIGHGSVIGMGSIVTKDVLPYSILGGNPAKLIRMRFDNNIIENLLRIKWWDFPDDKLEFYATNIQKPSIFIEQYLKNEKKNLNRL